MEKIIVFFIENNFDKMILILHLFNNIWLELLVNWKKSNENFKFSTDEIIFKFLINFFIYYINIYYII